MVKVLIYSSKEIYDNASFEGRAEASIIAYRDGMEYVIMKNRCEDVLFSLRGNRVPDFTLKSHIERVERAEWQRDKDSHKLAERYKTHPGIELMKNDA